MRKLAIFDLDGTLLNSLEDLAEACNHALSIYGYPTHPQQAYRYFVGNGVHNLILRALAPNNSAVSAGKVEAAFHAYYTVHAMDCTRPYDGVVEALEVLRYAGMQVAVLTNKPHDCVEELVDRFFPGLVDYAVGQRENVPMKPDPAAVYEILAHFRCQPQEAVFVGDSEVDIQTGKNADLFTVGVLWGFRTKDELERNGADVIIDKCSQLAEILVDNS